MATRSLYKIVLNNSIVLPEIYFSYSEAMAALKEICSSRIATYGRVATYDDQEDCIN